MCWSLIFDVKKVDKTTTFKLRNGRTINISTGPARFLGQTQSYSPFTTVRETGKHFSREFERLLNNVDSSLIDGEYKLWIFKQYLAPSFNFSLAVDAISETTLKKMQRCIYPQAIIKKWLGLTRSCTTAVIHHPSIIDIPTLSELRSAIKPK